jgi:uncharacterized protein VirK/YbjX
MEYIELFIGVFISLPNIVVIFSIYRDKNKKEYRVPYKAFYASSGTIIIAGIWYVIKNIYLIFFVKLTPF